MLVNWLPVESAQEDGQWPIMSVLKLLNWYIQVHGSDTPVERTRPCCFLNQWLGHFSSYTFHMQRLEAWHPHFIGGITGL